MVKGKQKQSETINMADIRELLLNFLERLSHNALPDDRKRETLDACN